MKFSTKFFFSIVAVTIIAAPLLGFTVLYSARAVLRESLIRNQLEFTQHTMDHIDRILYNAYQDIQIVAECEMIEGSLEILNKEDGRDEEAAESEEMLERALQEWLGLTGPWNILFAVDKEGIILASDTEQDIGKPVTHELSNELAYKAAMRGEIYYSDLVIPKITGKPTIIFAAPVRSEKEFGRPILGTVIGYFVWHTVLQMIDEADPVLRVHIFNRDGVIIGDRPEHRDRILQRSLGHLDPVKKAFRGRPSGTSIYTDEHKPDKTSVLGCYALQRGFLSYRGSGWGLLVEIPLDVVFAPVNRMARNIVIVVVFIMGLIAGVFCFIGKRLTNPIVALTKTTQSLGGGDFNARAEVTTKDEIGVLADSFNKMAEELQKLRDDLISSKDYTDNIINSMTDTLIVIDPRGNIESVNQSATDMLKYSQQELVGMPFGHIFEEEETLLFFKGSGLDHFTQKGSISGAETTLRTRDGEKVPVLASGSVMRDENGVILGVVCVASDITEIKRAEADLKKRTAELNAAKILSQSIVTSIPSALVTIDKKGRILTFNPNFLMLFGEKDFIGGQLTELVPSLDIHEVTDKILFEREEVCHLEVSQHIGFLGKEPQIFKVSVAGIFFQGRLPKKDEDAWFLVIFNNITESKHAETELKKYRDSLEVLVKQRTIELEKEIDERIRAEEKIRESQRKNKAILKAIPDLMFRVSKEGVFLDFKPNVPGDLYAPPEKIIGSNIRDIMPVEVVDQSFHYIAETLDTAVMQIFEYQLPMPTGVRDYEARMVVSGENEVLTVIRDISERKKAEKELKEKQSQLIQASKMASLGEIATGIAHEINQPLTYISTFIQNLGRDIRENRMDPEWTKDRLKKSAMQVERIQKIIQHLRIFGRSDAVSGEPVTIDIETVLKNTLLLMGERIRLRAIDLIVNAESQLPMIQGDPNQLEQVFINLLQNSADALADTGNPEIRVDIAASEDRKSVVIIVTDNGSGIEQEDSDRIFEPFFTTKEVGEGTGLGLSILYGIIKEHKGTITCHSEKNKGSTFVITLPSE
ncbi:PAS domain S-box protein [Desulfobacterales bacterium HSG2]|nr:PAS domain S-box protein [Desulfobacterales bacterium HSG2]